MLERGVCNYYKIQAYKSKQNILCLLWCQGTGNLLKEIYYKLLNRIKIKCFL